MYDENRRNNCICVYEWSECCECIRSFVIHIKCVYAMYIQSTNKIWKKRNCSLDIISMRLYSTIVLMFSGRSGYNWKDAVSPSCAFVSLYAIWYYPQTFPLSLSLALVLSLCHLFTLSFGKTYEKYALVCVYIRSPALLFDSQKKGRRSAQHFPWWFDIIYTHIHRSHFTKFIIVANKQTYILYSFAIFFFKLFARIYRILETTNNYIYNIDWTYN